MEKKNVRVNLLDLLILALAVFCVVGVVLRTNVKTTSQKQEMQTATVTFAVSNIKKDAVQHFKPGAPLYAKELDCVLGTFERATYKSAVSYIGDDGIIRKVESASGRVDMTGTFQCKGIWNPQVGFSIDGVQYIAPGMTAIVDMPEVEFLMEVLDVRVES